MTALSEQDSVHPSPAPGGTNGFAVAAAIFGFIGACPLGIALGAVALVQTARSRQRGRALAVLGIILSCLWIAGVVTFGKDGLPGGVDRDGAGAISGQGRASVLDLRVGDCVDSIENGIDVSVLPVVRCSKPHQAQVYAIVILPDSDFPGEEEIAALAERRCSGEMAELPANVVEDPEVSMSWLQPLESDWLAGDRRTACFVETASRRAGSLLGEHA